MGTTNNPFNSILGHPPEEPLWSARRRPFFGLPLSFCKYYLYADRIIIQSGFLTRRQEEIRLYRVLDVSMRQSLSQRLFQLGSIRLNTSDASSPKCFIHDVLHPVELARGISDLAETERNRVRVAVVEGF